MAREKKPVHKVQMTEGKRNIIQMLLQEYDIELIIPAPFEPPVRSLRATLPAHQSQIFR